MSDMAILHPRRHPARRGRFARELNDFFNGVFLPQMSANWQVAGQFPVDEGRVSNNAQTRQVDGERKGNGGHKNLAIV